MSTHRPRDGNEARRRIEAAGETNAAWLGAEDRTPLERFAATQESDPFPEVPAGLLNSADICAYARATGMLDPFDPSALKPASYGVKLAGPYVSWTEQGWRNKHRRVAGELEGDGDSVLLPKNSILFLTLEPYIRLPDYIAAAFNLRIDYIYRGLLVGTGPLVDPGFVGRLSVPLHNLTSNDYKFRWHEVLVWMEFRKLSPNPMWHPGFDPSHGAQYVPFDPEKTEDKSLDDYIARALDGHPQSSVESSIPWAIGNAERSARKAQRSISFLTGIGLSGLLGLGVTILALIVNTWGLIEDTEQNVDRKVEMMEQMLEEVQGERNAVEESLEELNVQQE